MGSIYQGDFKNGLGEGKGIMYLKNGDRRMGDYHNNNPIGKHVILTESGDIKVRNYN